MEEQATPHPSYLFLPQPIERQLVSYHLGTLLEVSKRGWTGHSRWRPRFVALIIAIISLVVTLVSLVGMYDVIHTTHIISSSLGLIPGLAGSVFLAGIYLLFLPSRCIGAFDEGFLYAKGTHVIVLYWAEIEACEQKELKKWYGRVSFLKIRTHDGRVIQMKARQYQLDKLGEIIREKIAG